MAIFNFQIQQFHDLLFIFLRISSILLFLPFFDNRSIPPIFKIGLSLSLTLCLMPGIQAQQTAKISYDISAIIGIISEIILGVCMGLSIKIIFTGIQLGAEIVGYQMGLAVANLFNAGSEVQGSVLANFKFMIAMLIFLSMNAHHFFLFSLAQSFVLIPPFGFAVNGSLANYIIVTCGKMFLIALKLSSPLVVTLLLSNIALGLIARMAPQMNIFFVAMPLNFIIGLLLIGLMIPFFSNFLIPIFNDFGNALDTVLKMNMP